MTLNTVVSTGSMAWDKLSSTFTVEASRLGWPAGNFGAEVRVRSARTGRVVTFCQVRFVFDPNNEGVLAVEYEANDRSAGPMKLFVLND